MRFFDMAASPLVRERSRVRFPLAAPVSLLKSTLTELAISPTAHSRAEQSMAAHIRTLNLSHSGFTARSVRAA